MASSMLTGDRRWGQTRKSGMTVLGKVPKPINLPSQRLENHGLDPNVEIVPKGTLTWGSRPSLTASNAWSSSSLSSPNTDGSSASPSRLSGRPSSGGSYTRPSTSASDRSHQAVSSAWGTNSRPSSASGILPSNQTSASVARPRSAETRPGTSKFSCFAEPAAEGAAWGATRTAEKLVSASNFNNFTLSSGDFPTLGSEKNPKSNVAQGHSSQGRPASASGRVSVQKETVDPPPTVPICEPTPTGNQTIAQLDKGNVNTWRRDNSSYTGSCVPPNSGNWHRDQQQMQTYPHNVPSQQFDSWLGPPMQSAPDGVWYRSGSPGVVCRPAGPSGSYPVESCIYYPHLSARPLSNSQTVPRHGPVVGGYGLMNGVPYRPAPDSYMVPNHPVGPMNPEVYPRQMHYENYRAPPTNLGNANEQEGPVLGNTPCSSLSNQHLNQNLNMDTGSLRAVPCYYGPSVTSEQAVESHTQESNGPQYKVLLKQHDGSEDNGAEENWDQSITDTVSLELGDSRPAPKKGSMDEPAGVIIQPVKGSDISSSVPMVHTNAVSSPKSETVDDHCLNTARKGEDPQKYSVKRSSTLIEKIESLNNKARLADSRSVIPAFVGEEKIKQIKNANIKGDPMKEAITGTILPEKSSPEKGCFNGDMENKDDRGDTNLESNVNVKVQLKTSKIHTSSVGVLGLSDVGLAVESSHKRVHNRQNRADFHAKSRSDSPDVEEWRKKSPGRDSSVNGSVEKCLVSRVQDCQPCQDASEKKEFRHMKVGDEKYLLSSMDPADYKAQHEKMKEIARQRAKQLQEEEDERIREQKARALAKLEELNRRTLGESSNQTVHPSTLETQSVEGAKTHLDPKTNIIAVEAPDFNSASTSAVVQKADDINILRVPAVLQPNECAFMLEQLVESSPQAVSLSVTPDPSMSLMQHGIKIKSKTDSQFQDNSVSKQKQIPREGQDNKSEEKHVLENVTIGVMVGSIIVGSKSLGESALPSSSISDGIHSISKDMDGPSMQHKKRNNRTTRNKNRVDEVSSGATAILQSAHRVCDDVKIEGCKPKSSESAVEDTPVPSEALYETMGGQKSSDVACASASQGSSEATTGAPAKTTVQWRPQPPKRAIRNPQATKSTDKLHGTEAVWAPVKSTNKKEPSEEVRKVTIKTNPDSSGRSGNDIELNLKAKRAEMERYVPKPIAKELPQQEIPIQLSDPCHHLAASGSRVDLGTQGPSDGALDHSVTVKAELPANTKNGENAKPNRHGKAHTSWRRRGVPESSTPLPNLSDGSSSFNSNTDAQKASYLQHPSKHDNSQKDQPNILDDGWNDDNNYMMQCEPNFTPLEKDHAKLNRGRRQPFKGHKVGNISSSRDNWEPGHGRTDKAMGLMMTMEADESGGRKSIRNENHSANGHPRSQWQPKSQTSFIPYHCQETVEVGAQGFASQEKKLDKESSLSGVGNHGQPIEGKSVSTAVPLSAEIRNLRHHEVKRERRAREEPLIRQSPTTNQESTLPVLLPQNADSQNEPISSGTRRHGQHSGWLARGQETSFGVDGGLEQDTGKHNLPTNVDRRKQYPRTGYYNRQNDSAQHNSAVGDDAQNVSKSLGKYRERSHNHPRRGGHFYSQNMAGGAYGNGE